MLKETSAQEFSNLRVTGVKKESWSSISRNIIGSVDGGDGGKGRGGATGRTKDAPLDGMRPLGIAVICSIISRRTRGTAYSEFGHRRHGPEVWAVTTFPRFQVSAEIMNWLSLCEIFEKRIDVLQVDCSSPIQCKSSRSN